MSDKFEQIQMLFTQELVEAEQARDWSRAQLICDLKWRAYEVLNGLAISVYSEAPNVSNVSYAKACDERDSGDDSIGVILAKGTPKDVEGEIYDRVCKMFPRRHVWMSDARIVEGHEVRLPSGRAFLPPESEVVKAINEVIQARHPGWKPWEPVRVILPHTFGDDEARRVFEAIKLEIEESAVVERGGTGGIVVSIPDRIESARDLEAYIRRVISDMLTSGADNAD